MNRTRMLALLFVPLLLGIVSWIGFGGFAGVFAAPMAAVIVVPVCTEAALDSALAQAAATPGHDVISFSTDCMGPNSISISSQKTITTPLTINGGSAVRMTATSNNRHFEVAPGNALTLTGILLANGNPATENGGSVWVRANGSLVLDTMIFRNNQTGAASASGGAVAYDPSTTGRRMIANTLFASNRATLDGGAVSSHDSLMIEDSRFISNTAAHDGGGLSVLAGLQDAAWITDTLFAENVAGNDGGGVSFYYGAPGGLPPFPTISIVGSVFRGNHTQERGGGLYSAFADVTITGSTFVTNTVNGSQFVGWGAGVHMAQSQGHISTSNFDSNSAQSRGGGLYVNGMHADVIVEDSSFVGNEAPDGAGVFVFLQANGDAAPTLRNNTFWENASAGGSTLHVFKAGLIQNPEVVVLENLTLHENSNDSNSAALYASGVAIDANHLTITGNALGARTSSTTTIALANSVLQNDVDCEIANGGSILSSHSLFATSSCGAGGAGDMVSAVNQLAGIQDNGGETLTRLPLADSLLLGSANTADCLATDQRGLDRTLDGLCDIGATELMPSDPPAIEATATAQAEATATAQATLTPASPTPTQTSTQTPTQTPTPTPQNPAAATATPPPGSGTPTANPSPEASQTPVINATPDPANDIFLVPIANPG